MKLATSNTCSGGQPLAPTLSRAEIWRGSELNRNSLAAPSPGTERQEFGRCPECFSKFLDHCERGLTSSAFPLKQGNARNADALREDGGVYASRSSDRFQTRGKQRG